MAEWVRVCALAEAPQTNQVSEAEIAGRMVCVANVNGELRVLGNLCPHRDGPLGQGWIEDGAVVCPWHSWAFDPATGRSTYPEGECVPVYRVLVRDGVLLAEVPGVSPEEQVKSS